MGPGNGDNLRQKGDAVDGTEVPAQVPHREAFTRVEDSPLNCGTVDPSARSTGQQGRQILDLGLGEIFPLCSNIGARLVNDNGTPTVVLEDGGVPLERYPLRNRRGDDPDRKLRFTNDMATITVDYSSTSIEVDVKPRGFEAFLGRWIPGVGSFDEWLAVDREPRDPNEITIVRPGGNRESRFLSA